MNQVRFARRALGDIERLERFCASQESSLWTTFMAELDLAVHMLENFPGLGVFYLTGPPNVRRILLRKTQYHVYYRFQPEKSLIVILALWSTRRGRSPSLR